MSSGLSFIGMIVMMVVLSPVLSLITVSFLALMIFIIKNIGSKSKYYFGMQQKNMGKLNYRKYLKHWKNQPSDINILTGKTNTRKKPSKISKSIMKT